MTGGVDLRGSSTAVRDQGRRGTCVSCAASSAHEIVRAEGVELSIEFLHWSAKRRDGLPRNLEGTTLPAANEALDQDGQPPEVAWPYDVARDQWAPTYQPPQHAIDEAKMRRMNGGEILVPDATSIRVALDRGRPVVLGIRLYPTWYWVEADGQIDLPDAGVLPLGGHAVLVVSYRGDEFIIQNSWGRDWGDEGFGVLPGEYVDRFGIAAWSFAAR